MEFLYSELRGQDYPRPLDQYTKADDIYTLGTMISAMTVADVRQFNPQNIFEDVNAFQSRGLSPGQVRVVVIQQKYLAESPLLC